VEYVAGLIKDIAERTKGYPYLQESSVSRVVLSRVVAECGRLLCSAARVLCVRGVGASASIGA